MGAFWAGVNASDPGVAHYNPVMLRPIPTPGMLEADPAVAWVQVGHARCFASCTLVACLCFVFPRVA